MSRKQEQEEARTEVTEVAPNVLRMELPVAIPGLRHVNCYALVDDERKWGMGASTTSRASLGRPFFETCRARIRFLRARESTGPSVVDRLNELRNYTSG